MKLFFRWLRGRWQGAALFALIFAVLALIFYLYRLPAEAVAYGFAVCLTLCVIVWAAEFAAFRRRHNMLACAVKNIEDASAPLPRPDDAAQADYAELAEALRRENTRLRALTAVRLEDMDDYYTLWAHQIKTPLAAMRLLLQSSGGALSEEDTAELEEELFRTEQYVELAMGYQKLSGDGSDLVIQACGLDAIVRQAVRKYARQFIRRGLSLDYGEIGMTVLTDEKWLQFIIEQVLSNALKYTKTGGISIFQRGESELVIEDTGTGIAPEDLPRIFERGFTGYNGRADKKSTGIGLYLCRLIAGRLGHTISAESEPGKGTRIILGLARSALEVE
jgi:signal transduction histidine kinase